MSNFSDRLDVESSFVVSDPRVGTSGEVNARNRLEIRELDGEHFRKPHVMLKVLDRQIL